MSWYRNVSRNSIRTTMANGESVSFPPHVKVWVDDSQFTSEMQVLVNNNILKYRGTDATLPIQQLVVRPPVSVELDWIDAQTVDLGTDHKHNEIVDLNYNDPHDILLDTEEDDDSYPSSDIEHDDNEAEMLDHIEDEDSEDEQHK